MVLILFQVIRCRKVTIYLPINKVLGRDFSHLAKNIVKKQVFEKPAATFMPR